MALSAATRQLAPYPPPSELTQLAQDRVILQVADDFGDGIGGLDGLFQLPLLAGQPCDQPVQGLDVIRRGLVNNLVRRAAAEALAGLGLGLVSPAEKPL